MTKSMSNEEKADESTKDDDSVTLDMPEVLWEQLYVEFRHSLKNNTDTWRREDDLDPMVATTLKNDIRRGPLQEDRADTLTLTAEQLTCCWQASCDFMDEMRDDRYDVSRRQRSHHEQVARSLVIAEKEED
jgi:hypothetical protein